MGSATSQQCDSVKSLNDSWGLSVLTHTRQRASSALPGLPQKLNETPLGLAFYKHQNAPKLFSMFLATPEMEST